MGFQSGVEVFTLNRFCFSWISGGERKLHWVHKTFWDEPPKHTASHGSSVQVLQSVCSISAGNKGKQIFLLMMLHNVLFHKFVNLCKSVHSVPKKTKPLSKQVLCCWAAKQFSWEANHSESWSVFSLEDCRWSICNEFFFFQSDIFLPETFQGTITPFLQNIAYPETQYYS